MLYNLVWLTLFNVKGLSQTQMPCYWENGNITFFNDLGRVDILTKRGYYLKHSILWHLDTVRNVLTFKYQGVLHDLYVTDIQALYSCELSRHMIILSKHQAPKVVYSDQGAGDIAKICDFRYSIQVLNDSMGFHTNGPVSINQLIFEKDKNISNDSSRKDSLAISDGEYVKIQILSIDKDLFMFKRVGQLENSIYALPINKLGILHQTDQSITLYLKKSNQ